MLHLGQQVAHVLAVAALLAVAAKWRRGRRHSSRASANTGASVGLPGGAQFALSRAEAARRGQRIDGVARRTARPCTARARRSASRRRSVDSSVPSPRRTTQSAACCSVVARLLRRLAGDRGELGIARRRKPLPVAVQPDGERRRLRSTVNAKSPRGSSGERDVAVVALVAQKGELVFVAHVFRHPAGVRQQRARLAEQVERHVGERDVFFEHRRVAAPLGEALRRIRQVSARRSTYCCAASVSG